MVPWLLAEGKGSLKNLLDSVGDEFLESQQTRFINKTAALVNMKYGVSLQKNERPEHHIERRWAGEGWVKVQRRGGDVYVEDRKISFCFPKAQLCMNVCEQMLRKESSLNANILEAMLRYPKLIPKGEGLVVFFTDTVIGDPKGFFVQGIDLDSHKIKRLYFHEAWQDNFCVALLERAELNIAELAEEVVNLLIIRVIPDDVREKLRKEYGDDRIIDTMMIRIFLENTISKL